MGALVQESGMMDEKDQKKREETAIEVIKDMDLEKIDEATILGKPFNLEIKNLVVTPMPSTKIGLGDVDSLRRFVINRIDIEAIVWNEDRITLLTESKNDQIAYQPEIHPAAKLFFRHEEKRLNRGWFEEGILTWEGDCEPVQFTKRMLLKFIRTYGLQTPKELEDAVKQLKVSETFLQDTIMLDEDSDNERRVEEESETTNLPKKFKLTLPLAEGILGEMDFEARICKMKADYGRQTDKRGVEVRCTNSRKVLRGMMDNIMEKLPKDIPRYYGIASVEK